MENLISQPEIFSLWYRMAVALLIGLFIGLERERRKIEGDKAFAGVRTFPLISLLGFASGILAEKINPFILLAIFSGFALLIAISYFFSAKRGEQGGTSEVAMILVFVMGILVYFHFVLFSAALTIVIAILLTYKTEFRKLAGAIEREDLFATIKFAILTIIILPLLPDKALGPLGVFNPRKIWYLVVLIAGISFIGYVLFKIIGTKKGIPILSILGGIASSTALTLSFTERSKDAPALSRNFAAGILLASSIMFPRVLIIIGILNFSLAEQLFLPFGILTVSGLLGSFVLWHKKNSIDVKNFDIKNPFKMLFAIKFGLIFTAILFISKLAQMYFGDSGVYLTGIFAGVADVDAIALSITNLVGGSLNLSVAAVAIVLAAFSNSITKAVIASTLGTKDLRKNIIKGFSFLLFGFIIIMLIQ